MKKLVAILMIFVATFASAGVAGIVAVPVVDSERVARAVLSHEPIAWYSGYLGFTRVSETGEEQNIYTQFLLYFPY